MHAWMGGRRKLIKEQKARKRLEGVLKAVTTKRKPSPAGPQDLDALVTRFRKLAPASKVPAFPGDNAPIPSSSRSLGTSLDLLAISGPSQNLRAHSPALDRPQALRQRMEEDEEPQTPRVLQSSSGNSAAAEDKPPAVHLASPQAARSSEQ